MALISSKDWIEAPCVFVLNPRLPEERTAPEVGLLEDSKASWTR